MTEDEMELVVFNCINQNDFKKAFEMLKSFDCYDSEYLLMMLGWLYETGLGGVANKDISCSLYTRAAEIGCISANYRVGLLKEAQGQQIEAREHFFKGARVGHLASKTKIGEILIEGAGGNIKKEKEGIKLLLSAAGQGHIRAKRTLICLELRNKKTFVGKLFTRMKFILLFRDACKEYWLNKNSPKVEL
jgi:TPR repeat protein